MPDLSHKASTEYWYQYNDPLIYRVIIFMESVEEWTLDGDVQLETVLTQLGKELDNVASLDLAKLGHEDLFIRLVGNIKSGRGLRLLQAIDIAQPGSASKILMHAETTTVSSRDPAGFFLKRNIVFERLRLLTRTFSKYRLKLVESALEGGE